MYDKLFVHKISPEKKHPRKECFDFCNRSDGIWTHDLSDPNAAPYQAGPRSAITIMPQPLCGTSSILLVCCDWSRWSICMLYLQIFSTKVNAADASLPFVMLLYFPIFLRKSQERVLSLSVNGRQKRKAVGFRRLWLSYSASIRSKISFAAFL